MKTFNIIFFCLFFCHSAFAKTNPDISVNVPERLFSKVSKTNPDISVNVLLLGKKTWTKEKQEQKKPNSETERKPPASFSPFLERVRSRLQQQTGHDHSEEHEDHGEKSDHHFDDGLSIQEVEFYFKSNIDPYWSGQVSLGISQHGRDFDIDLEEAYVDSLFIPSLTLRTGKFYAFLGRHNNLHTHYYPFIDPPLINQNLFGFHGWNNPGASLAYLSPLPWYSEIIIQGFYESEEEKPAAGILFLKNLWDLGAASTLELDLSYSAGIKTFQNLWNASLVWKWKPLQSAKQYSLSWTAELLQTLDDSSSDNIGGAHSYIQWRFFKNWWLEGRAEYLSHNKWSDIETQKYSFLVSFAATEYSAIRVQYDAAKSEHTEWEHSVSIQSNMSLGAHPAHLY